MGPLISIVIPTYNRADMIGRCLASVLNQTYENWEAIVVDNNSSDNTDEVVLSLKDSRIKFLKIENEGIIGKSRNLGINSAGGEWIAFLDSDDLWAPTKLEYCLANIETNIDLLYHGFDLEKAGSKGLRKRIKSWSLKKPVLVDLLVRGNAIVNSSVMVRRALFEKIGFINEAPEVNAAIDFNTWLRIASVTDSFLYLPCTLGTYVVHDRNVSERDMSTPFRAAIADFVDQLSQEQEKYVASQYHYLSGRYNYLLKNYEVSASDLRLCVAASGFSRRIKAIIMLTKIRFSR